MSIGTTTVRIPKKLGDKLAALAKKTGRTQSYYMRQALEEWLEDQEDYLLAMQRLSEKGERIPFEKVVKDLGLED